MGMLGGDEGTTMNDIIRFLAIIILIVVIAAVSWSILRTAWGGGG